MSRFHLETATPAPPEIVFNACLHVETHVASMTKSKERVIGGVTSGKLKLGDTVVSRQGTSGCFGG